MALSRRGQRTLPFLEDIGEYVEPPIYFPSVGRGAPLADVVNLGTAENWLLRKELLKKFQQYISNDFTISDLSYVSGLGGAPKLLEGLANYFNLYFHPVTEVVPDRIVTAPGASHLLESVLFNVCDEGAAVLIQTPYWPGFDEALTLRNRLVARHVDVPFDDPNTDFFGPGIVNAYYEYALRASPEPVHVLVICNPHNPIGRCYPVETLEELLKFAQRNDLHVIVDELYGMSVYDSGDQFHSILSIDLVRLKVDPWRVHVVYSFSKDLNSSGIRLGIFVTQDNHALRDAIAAQQQSKLSAFTSVAAAQFLLDAPVLKDFIARNPGLLQDNFAIIKHFLDHYKVHYILPTSGLFIFAKFLENATVEEEKELEKKFETHLVRVHGGSRYYSIIPGFFRVVFAVEKDRLILGLHRIENTLKWSGWEPPQNTDTTNRFR